mgnify:CR=1 FL=1
MTKTKKSTAKPEQNTRTVPFANTGQPGGSGGNPASRLPLGGAPPAIAAGIRELARAVGRSHAAVGDWVRHPEWDQARTPPWNVTRAAAWAARTLAPDPAKAWRDTPVVDAGLDGGLEALRRNPLSAAKLKLTLTRAEKLDLERRILAADLVPRRAVEDALVRRVHAVRSAFQALPRHVAGRLVGCNENQIETVLDEEIRAVLLELSQQIELPEPPNTESHYE